MGHTNVETTISSERDARTGRYLPGNSGNGGRKPGSRNKLGEAFIADLATSWERHGVKALERCAEEDPAQYCRIIASLLPREASLDVDVTVGQAQTALEAYRTLQALPTHELMALRNATKK
jgi:hypothetical protein